jgi:hypothetical protein
MEKTEKEIAFLRGLTVEPEWTQKFTDLFDEKVKIDEILTLTYLNAGAGNHAIELAETLGAKVQIFPVCESQELSKHAQLKADTAEVAIDFATTAPIAESDYVIADVSLLTRQEVEDMIPKVTAAAIDNVGIFLPTAGSFGDVFSYLWEVLLDFESENKDDAVEELVASIPTVSHVEELLKKNNLRGIKSHVKIEHIDFEDGRKFVESPMIRFFFMPKWMKFVPEKDKERVLDRLAQKIDEGRDELTFRVSIKVGVFTGKR